MLSTMPHMMLSTMPHKMLRTMPHTMLRKVRHTILSTMPRTILSTMPHMILSTMPHTMLRTMPLNFLNCGTGNRIIWTHGLTLNNLSLSSVTFRAANSWNFYLQHAECVFEFKWLYITVTSSISHDPSSIGCTTQRPLLPKLQVGVSITHIILLLLATGKCLIKYSWTLT